MWYEGFEMGVLMLMSRWYYWSKELPLFLKYAKQHEIDSMNSSENIGCQNDKIP